MIIALLLFTLLVVAFVSWWRPPLALAAIILLWPAYLVRATILHIPTTLLEVAVYGAVIGAVIGLITGRQKWSWSRWSPIIWIGLGLWLIAWAVAAAASPTRDAALGAFKAWCADPLLFAGLIWLQVKNTAAKKLIIRAALLSATIVAAAGLYQIVFIRTSLPDGRLSSFFHPVANFAAMYLAPLLILGLALVVFRAIEKFWIWPLAMIAGALLATLSYGGFFGVAVGGVIIWAYLPKGKIKTRLAIAAVIVTTVFIGTLATTDNFREHFSADRSSGLVRSQIWVTSWELIKQHPLVGIGPNNFEAAYRAEVPIHFWPPLEWLVAQPHNLYLALWLETGLLGLLVFCLALARWITAVGRLIKHSVSRPIGIASLAAMATVLVHGLVDTPYFKNDLAVLFIFLFILPWLIPEQEIAAPRKSSPPIAV